MREVMQGTKRVEVVVNEVLIHSAIFRHELETLKTAFKWFHHYSLTIKPNKCLIGHEKVPFFDHVVGESRSGCQIDKTEKVRNVLCPQTKT